MKEEFKIFEEKVEKIIEKGKEIGLNPKEDIKNWIALAIQECSYIEIKNDKEFVGDHSTANETDTMTDPYYESKEQFDRSGYNFGNRKKDEHNDTDPISF